MTISSNQPLNTNQLPVSLDVNPEDKDFQNILLLYLRRVANAVNTKESGLRLLQETANFQQWFQSGNPQQNRSGYLITVDFVALNGGNIPTGTTNITLTSSTQPAIINGFLYPIPSWGGATDTAGLSYFPNDPDVYVRYNSSTNTFVIQNNTANAMTWFVWVMQYLKN